MPGGPTTTCPPGGVDDNDDSGNGPAGRSDGKLPRTGADTIEMLVRMGVILLVAGFVLYLAERNRRAARDEEASGAGTA